LEQHISDPDLPPPPHSSLRAATAASGTLDKDSLRQLSRNVSEEHEPQGSSRRRLSCIIYFYALFSRFIYRLLLLHSARVPSFATHISGCTGTRSSDDVVLTIERGDSNVRGSMVNGFFSAADGTPAGKGQLMSFDFSQYEKVRWRRLMISVMVSR
jgi:hypothetical protein